MKRFFLGDEDSGINKEKLEWVKATFQKENYTVRNDGFIYDEYHLVFNNERDEILYELKWS